jgi:prepilin-type N-terminal cleavage/methylation domain-containing protein
MRRRGTTLLEMLTVISLLAVLLTIGTTLLISLMRMHKRVTSDIDQRRTQLQLADRFRQDAHAAGDAQMSPEGKLILTLAGGRVVEYAAAGSHITRQVLEAGEVRHREIFTFTPACKIEFAQEKAEASEEKLVRCQVLPAGGIEKLREQLALESVLEAAVGIAAELPPSPQNQETSP